jgi:hypothetical protein
MKCEDVDRIQLSQNMFHWYISGYRKINYVVTVSFQGLTAVSIDTELTPYS